MGKAGFCLCLGHGHAFMKWRSAWLSSEVTNAKLGEDLVNLLKYFCPYSYVILTCPVKLFLAFYCLNRMVVIHENTKVPLILLCCTAHLLYLDVLANQLFYIISSEAIVAKTHLSLSLNLGQNASLCAFFRASSATCIGWIHNQEVISTVLDQSQWSKWKSF